MHGICVSCHEVYKMSLLERGQCPKAACRRPVVVIDELMIPVILTLNTVKNYKTTSCCSGHQLGETYTDCGIWIHFEKHIQELPSIPEGFFIKKLHSVGKEEKTLRLEQNSFEFDSSSEDPEFLQRHQYQFNGIDTLNRWALGLTPLPRGRKPSFDSSIIE